MIRVITSLKANCCNFEEFLQQKAAGPITEFYILALDRTEALTLCECLGQMGAVVRPLGKCRV